MSDNQQRTHSSLDRITAAKMPGRQLREPFARELAASFTAQIQFAP